MIYLDSDNALGAPSGDIDDAFAIAALLAAGVPLLGIGSVAGNTDEKSAHRNNLALLDLFGMEVSCLQGAACGYAKSTAASEFLCKQEQVFSILALGPLSNIAQALDSKPEIATKIKEIIFVGGNTKSWGRWPPVFPFEFNLTKDKQASVRVCNSSIPLTIVPLNQARRLRICFEQLSDLPQSLAEYFSRHGKRWFQRSRYLKFSKSIPLWDLVAAFVVLMPEQFSFAETVLTCHQNAWIEFGSGQRKARVVEDYCAKTLWKEFLRAVKTQVY